MPVLKPGLVHSRSYAHSCSSPARSDTHRWQIVTPIARSADVVRRACRSVRTRWVVRRRHRRFQASSRPEVALCAPAEIYQTGRTFNDLCEILFFLCVPHSLLHQFHRRRLLFSACHHESVVRLPTFSSANLSTHQDLLKLSVS